ncbi:nitric oxide reductase activation protein NorD [Sedimenticola thiotaurini]|uniref:Nitric oxide reductase activation protein n=1 Tax=Sedimenticola thiotaurini TaxID=1543721 RepID=A0A0F7JZS3_9GAMM|nr:nitric oxide reductase activation protein [Sedimenticola thiotaurini]AKH20088.1 nitric oxide reductase activation protein [Sedimenticola thiotaurini]
MPAPRPLAEIRHLLDELLEVEFSFRDTAAPAAAIAELPGPRQAQLISWIQRVASTHVELGYQVACQGVEAQALMEPDTFEAWIFHSMDRYDAEGLRPALLAIEQYRQFAEQQQARRRGALLLDHEGVLSRFLQGLSGRPLKLASADRIYTDSETLYLPPLFSLLPSPAQNFQHYKATCALLWAQIQFGSFRPLLEIPSPEPDLLQLYHALEMLRLEARLKRTLPGLYRELEQTRLILQEPDLPAPWQALSVKLSAPDMRARDTLELARQQLGRLTPYPPRHLPVTLDLEAVRICMAARIEKERARFKVALNSVLEELQRNSPAEQPQQRRFSKRQQPDTDAPEGFTTEILLDDMPAPLPDQVQALQRSILLDLGEIPDEYLQPAGPGEYDATLLQDQNRDADDVWRGSYHEEGAHLYDEWDFQRRHYRKQWCAVREREVTPRHDDFVARTLEKYHGLIKHLRKTFEAMRHENRLLKRQPQGDDVDIDALVEALSDAHLGFEMTDRLLTRMQRDERDIAVIFMVDMSGSTKGWINDAERESLLLLCEALESLGDRYAIYGFSGMTRKRCELFHIKYFEEPYGELVRARISGIEPQDYTRMGFAIRHLSKILQATDAKTRILITLSDGKPDDYDSYRGQYGIEDTRRALIEARRSGIHPYCITIDEEARDYLPHLYGPAAYSVVDDVRTLPLKVSDIYRRLTT